MKKFSLIILISILSTQIYGQTLHALLFVNKQERGRETDRYEDMKNMAAFYRDIARRIGYNFQLSENSGREFTAAEVKHEINNLRVASNDIIVFYYSGHGYNQGKDKWPTLNLLDENYWFSDILKVLNRHKSKAKLLLCIADCCNKGFRNANLPGASFNPIESANIRKLFTDFKGKKTILMSASKQGQYSWSDTQRGSLFGISYRAALYALTDNSNSNPTWDKVLKKAQEYTQRASNYKQEPQYQIIHTGNPFEF